MTERRDGGQVTTPMAYVGDERPLRGDPPPAVEAGGGAVLPGPVHSRGAGSDGAPVAGGEAGRSRAAVPGDRLADARVDDDGDARGALASARRGRVPARARPSEERVRDRLSI